MVLNHADQQKEWLNYKVHLNNYKHGVGELQKKFKHLKNIMAQIGWIDFSPSHRDKIGAALDLLRPEGMVDELGMATIRDALANQMFPGITKSFKKILRVKKKDR